MDRPAIKICPQNSKIFFENEYLNDGLEIEGPESTNSKSALQLKENSNKHLTPQSEFNEDDSEGDEDYTPTESSMDSEVSSENHNLQSEDRRKRKPITQFGSNPDEDQGWEEDLDMGEESNSEVAEDECSETSTDIYKEKLTRLESVMSKPKAKSHSYNSKLDRRLQTQILHSAFPSSSYDVCKYVIDGTKGDTNEAWEVMSLGYPASKSQNELADLLIKNEKCPVKKSTASSESSVFRKSNCQDLIKASSENIPIPSTKSKSLPDKHENCGAPPNFKTKIKTLPYTVEKACESFDFNAQDFPEIIKNNKSTNIVNSCCDEVRKCSEISSTSQNKQEKNTASLKNLSLASVKRKSVNNSSSDSDNDDSTDISSSKDGLSEKSSILTANQNLTKTFNATQQKGTLPSHVAPGKGKKATKRRNERRRISNTMQRLKKKGIIPAGISKDEFKILHNNRKSSATHQKDSLAKPNSPSTKILNRANADDEFQRRRKELLDSLEFGRSIDLGKAPETKSSLVKPSQCQIEQASQTLPTCSTLGIHVETGVNPAMKKVNNPKSCELLISGCSDIPMPDVSDNFLQAKNNLARVNQEDLSLNRRLMLDLDAGKRILYHAMGFRPPKTNQDKEKIRIEVMKNTKTINVSKRPELELKHDEFDEKDSQNSQAWREKIIYRAVECVQKGVELSEPPFPFSQRWDPQQRTRKRKMKQNSNNDKFDHQEYLSKKQKKCIDVENLNSKALNCTEKSCEPGKENLLINEELNEINVSSTLSGKVYDENAQQPQDLVSLPADLSSLENLTISLARNRMIIVFKQLEVSAATRWQPQISDYKTAVITSIDNEKIQVQLAHRDLQVSEKLYNDNGDRIYNGFDAIEVEEMEDDGLRDLNFSELVDPKIVKFPEENLNPNEPIRSETGINESTSLD